MLGKNKTVTFDNWASPDSKASHIAGKYMEWQSYKSEAMERWKETEAYIYATDTTSLPGGDVFDHTTHVPIVHELRDELISIMFSTILPNEDFLGWIPFDKESSTQDKRRKALAYIKNRHALNGFRKTIDKLITDVIDYGVCFSQVQYVDYSGTDSSGVPYPGYAGPVVKRFSPYDVTMDPTAARFEDTPKIIRTLLTMGEFISLAESQGWDQEEVAQIVEKRGTYGTVDFSDNKKNKQYTPDGFGSIEQYYTSGMVEVLYFYGAIFDDYEGKLIPDRCVVVADRTCTLSDEECKDPMSFMGSWKPKQDNLWAQGALDQIIGINFQINHRENALSTSIDRFIYPDRVQLGDVEISYDPRNGSAVYLAPEGGGVQDLSPDATVLSYDNQVEKLTAKARMALGLPPSVMGFRSPGEKTAFEVQSLNDGAFRSFIHKAERFELDVVEKIVNSELKVGRDNIQSIMQVEAIGSGGVPSMLNVTQKDLTSNGKLVPWGARRFALQNKQMNTLNMLANSNLGQLIGTHLNTFTLAKVVEELGGFNEFGMISEFAAIEEQFKQQQLANTAQQMIASDLEQQQAMEDGDVE